MKNREIKFRAWDKENKCFLKDSTWMGHYDDLYFEDLNMLFVIDNLTFLQYTGLKDRRGIEIYESDLIKNQHGTIAKAVWSDRRHGWDFLLKYFDGFETLHEWEIIGNIYENPELLK